MESHDRMEDRDDLPEDVRHPNTTGPVTPFVIAMAVLAVLLVAVAVIVTII
jgi:hypothetical protein